MFLFINPYVFGTGGGGGGGTATGGTITTSGAYTIHTFSTGDNFIVSGGSLTCDVLIIAGGGGGGGSGRGGGGGAGGLI